MRTLAWYHPDDKATSKLNKRLKFGRPLPEPTSWFLQTVGDAAPFGEHGVADDIVCERDHLAFSQIVELAKLAPSSSRGWSTHSDHTRNLFHRQEACIRPFLTRFWPQYFLISCQVTPSYGIRRKVSAKNNLDIR